MAGVVPPKGVKGANPQISTKFFHMRQNSVEHEFKGILYVAIHICLGKTIYAHLSELDNQHKDMPLPCE